MQRKKKICKSCQKETYIYSHKLCLPCYKRKFPYKFELKSKTELKSKSSLKTTKKLNKTSKKQEHRLKIYRVLRDNYFKKIKECEFIDENGIKCKCKKLTLHHKGGRRGSNLYKNFMALCQEHHEWVHRNAKKARLMKYLL